MHMKAECKYLEEMCGDSLFSELVSPEHRSKQYSTNSEKLLFQKMCNPDFCLKLLIISKRIRNIFFFTVANDDS